MEEEIAEEKIVPKEGLIRKILRIVLYSVIGFFVLNAILYLVLSIPFIQKKLVNFASDELSSMLKTEVTVKSVRFNLFSHATIKGLYVEDHAKDTLVYANYLDAELKPLDFILRNKLHINHVQLDDFFINITANDSISDYNFQFLIDEFSSSDTTKVDTTSSSLAIVVDDVKITNGRLRHRIMSDSVTPNLFNVSDIYVTDFNASVSVKSVDMENLDIHVNSISAKEQTGLAITDLKGHVLSKGSRIWVEDLLLSLPNSHLKPSSVFYDLTTDEFELVTSDTELAPQDLLPFYADLKFLRHNLKLDTKLKGKLPMVNLEKITLNYGTDAVLEGKAFISSYADLENASFTVDIDKLQATPRGIGDFAKLGDPTFQTPSILDTLGTTTLNARLKGQLKAFDLNAKASTRTGSINLDANGQMDTTFTDFDVKAKLYTNAFNLAPIVGKESGIGKLTMHANLEARQKGEGTLTAKLKGSIDSLDLLHGAVVGLPFAGYFDPHKMGFGADARLHFGRIMAGFEMSRAVKPDIKFGLEMQNIDVAHFYKNKLWDKPLLSFKMKGDVKKLDIDDLNADISISDLQFIDSTFNYLPGPIELKAWKDTTSIKYISLRSSILSANIKGDYRFSTISDEFSGLMHDYLSNVFESSSKKKLVNANNFIFDFTVHNSEELSYIFDLPMDIIEPLVIDGIINTKERTIDIVGQLPLARNSSVDIVDTRLNIANMDSAFNIKLDTDIKFEGSTYDLDLLIKGSDNSLRSLFQVENDTVGMKVKGSVDALAQFTKGEEGELTSFFQVVPSDIQIGAFAMNVLPAKILNKNEKTHINNFGIGINRKKYLDVNGIISASKDDSLKIRFNKAQIGDVLQGINIHDIYAEIDGSIAVTNTLNTPELYTEDLQISNIILYKDTVGTLNVNTRWNSEMGGIALMSTLTQKKKQVMELNGLVDPAKETLNLHMDVDRFSINWLKPFLVGLLNDISGDISSHFTIKGTFDEPVTEGFLGFNNTKIGVDYTNVVYTIADTIDITPERIGFDNLILRDSQGNKATVNARLTHRNFKEIKYSLDMRATNLMVLNTQSRTDSLFYGRVFASGTVKIDGSDDGIDLNLQLKNGKNSSLNVTIPQVSEATDYKSVVYINVPVDKLPKEEDEKNKKVREKDIPIRINLKLEVDPNIMLAVVIDPVTGDQMNIKGNGTISFNYNMETEAMSVYGDYIATDGGVRLNLQNISKLEFKIREGSKLDFIGDPLKTKFNITAYRRVKADLRTLDQSFELENTSPRVQVDCVLGISGDIERMDLTYDVELFEAGDDLQRKLKSIVNTDEMRIKQFAYLIASGTFFSNTSSSGANFSDGMWTKLASSTLSNGLNSAFGNVLGDKWEIGTDISSNDGTFSDMDMSVNATTRLFDDKLKLHANVGYRSDNTATSDDSFIGDFDVEYMLNTTWTLKAYSHTNDRFYRQAPTTQGVGIVFTREGPTLKRLFKSFNRRRGQWARERQNGEARPRREGDADNKEESATTKPGRGHQKSGDETKESESKDVKVVSDSTVVVTPVEEKKKK